MKPSAVDGTDRAPILEAVGLSKRYGNQIALAGLDLSIRAGEVYGLVGPNGAGKTTALGLLLGLLTPSAGRMRIQGLDIAQHPIETKRHLGYLPEQVFILGLACPPDGTAWACDSSSSH